MTDDELLRSLGKIARETDPARDPRWDALSEKTLSDADGAALRELSRSSPAAATAYEAFRPVDDVFLERVTQRIEAKHAADRRRRSAGALVAFGSMAAVLALVFSLRTPDSAPHLPGYALTLTGGEREVRGASDPPPQELRLGPGSRAEISLRPATVVDGAVAVKSFLAQGADVRAWDAPVEVASGGAVRIQGDRERLFEGVPAGRWELIFVVGRPAELPSSPAALREAIAPGDAHRTQPWTVLRTSVTLLDASGRPAPAPVPPAP